VKSSADFPLKRIVLAVALSLLVHSLLLWQWPKIEFPQNPELPPLQAKLEPLPRLVKKPPAHLHKKKPLAPPVPVAEPVAEAVSAASAPVVSEAASAVAAAEPVPAAESKPPQLPRHAQLRFAVHYSSGSFKVGEVVHRLDIVDGHYTLQAETKTTGVVSIFKNFSLRQTSTGLVTRLGLRPDTYMEEKADGSHKQAVTVHFDWDAKQANYSSGNTSRLREGAQDLLSLPYHLSQQALNVVSIPVALSYGNSVNQYYIAVGEEVSVSTPMGELRAIPLSKVHGANEEGLIMWLALEYRLLPVKILYLDKTGEVSANMVITDIRVSDE
jgi:hypothetical protein